MPAEPSELIALQSTDTTLQVCPRAGGIITAYRSQKQGKTYDWLWPAHGQNTDQRDSPGLSCFPLVPYSNRIRNGTFSFDGRQITLAKNFHPGSHTIHGHGWQQPWQVRTRSATELSIVYHHAANQWVWSYSATQIFCLYEDILTITLALKNTSRKPMPAGVGLHPYFVKTAGTRVRAAIDKMWLTDAEVMPRELVRPEPVLNPSHGLSVDEVVVDNVYTGWERSAVIEWPEWPARLTLTASEPLDFLVIYSPAEQPFFCIEPVSHMTDAFNLAADGSDDTGRVVLPPGETLSVTISFVPEIL